MSSFFFLRLLDAVYPPTCLECECDGTWTCEDCLTNVEFFQGGDDPLILTLGSYANPLLRKLLTHLKYRSAHCVIGGLTELLRAWRLTRGGVWPWAGESSLLVCVIPSDERRMRERGFDHIVFLQKIVAEELVPWAVCSNLLRRSRHVMQNASLPVHAIRATNVQGVFEAVEPIHDPVLLIDDVYTTGATWKEAARVLHEAGAPKIYGFVFAKGCGFHRL